MSPMPLADAMFLLGESRDHPMHVGGLQVFELPDDAGPGYLGDMYQQIIADPNVDRLFRRRATRSLRDLGQWSWVEDDDLDLEYHVRLSALPQPGRVRELLALTSRLHGTLLDRHRPLWEGHLIEGLEHGRFAVYTKMSHAMLDGVSALHLLRDALSPNPDERDMPAPWALGDRRSYRQPERGSTNPSELIADLARTAGDAAGIGPALLATARRVMSEQAAAAPFQAPRSMFNVPITGGRRFAAQSWDLERVSAIRQATGATLNDVVLAMSSGALRQYLIDHDALPDEPLVAMVPVSLHTEGDASGNSVGTILCNLATDQPDSADRLDAIRESMQQGKDNLKGLSQLQITALSAITMAPLGLAPLFRFGQIGRPVFNLVISNIPGPKLPLYWNGSRLEGVYPLSIPLDGQAFNITVTTYDTHLEFGLVGCRQKVPHLQRMLDHLETSLAALESAAGV